MYNSYRSGCFLLPSGPSLTTHRLCCFHFCAQITFPSRRSLVLCRPQFFFRTADVTGTTTLNKDIEMIMPGDNAALTVDLIYPIAMEEGLRFAIREGGRTVGAGVVSKVIE